MLNIKFNLIAAVNNYVFVSLLGGSKPPPYHVVVCFVSFATTFGCILRFADSRIFSLPCVKGAGLLWRPLHLMQKHRPNRQVRRWAGVRELEGNVKLTNYLVQRREGLTPFVRVMICGCMNIHFGFACF